MRRTSEPALAPLVRRGAGVLSTSTIARLVDEGRLHTVLPGVHLRSDVASDPRWRASAVAAWRPEAVLLGGMAAALTFWPQAPTEPIHVACRTSVQRAGFRFERREIPTELVIYLGQVRLTHPALTALDLASTSGGESIDQLLRSRMARIEDLEQALLATPNRRGNADRRRHLLDSRAEPWSAAERLAHRILHGGGVRGWRANLPVRIHGRRYYLDIAFEGIGLVIEIDGLKFHTGRDAFESDRERQNALVLSGWTVLRFTYQQLVTDADSVLAQVREGIRLARRRRRREQSWDGVGGRGPISAG